MNQAYTLRDSSFEENLPFACFYKEIPFANFYIKIPFAKIAKFSVSADLGIKWLKDLFRGLGF